MNSDLLRRLAEFDIGEPRVLSVYLDMRPQESGESPGRRTALTIFRDRLREIESTIKRKEELDTFQADVTRIEDFLTTDFDTATQGLAVFACGMFELFETVEVGVPLQNHVVYGSKPELYQLARMMDDLETSVVAVVDTNTCRLFVMRSGFMNEVGGPDRTDNAEFHKHKVGGWSQARFQRHIQNNREEFAREAAEAIEKLATHEGASHLVVAGNEVAVPLLKKALSAPMQALLHEETPRIHIRAGGDEVQSEVTPILTMLEAEQDRTIVERLVEGVRGGGLAVTGIKRTRQALEIGQVDTLVIADDMELDETKRNDLVQLAAMTSASVEVVAGHETLRELGGIGGLLRYAL
jgi:peptide chain release factor subunit 1